MWDNCTCTQYEANELGKIQHRAARIVSGATKLVSIDIIEIVPKPTSVNHIFNVLMNIYEYAN